MRGVSVFLYTFKDPIFDLMITDPSGVYIRGNMATTNRFSNRPLATEDISKLGGETP